LDGELEWDANKAATKKERKKALLVKAAKEAADNISESLSKIEFREQGERSGYRMFSDDFRTLFNVNSYIGSDGTDYETVESVIKKLRSELGMREYGYIKEALVLEELRYAMESSFDVKLAQREWEEEARRMAIDVLIKLDQEFEYGHINALIARDIAWQVRPFVTNHPVDQIVWAEVTEPMNKVLVSEYKDLDSEGILKRFADARVLRKDK
jgi:hypothetical protein